MENIRKVRLMSTLLCIVSSAAVSGEFDFLVKINMGLLLYWWRYIL